MVGSLALQACVEKLQKHKQIKVGVYGIVAVCSL